MRPAAGTRTRTGAHNQVPWAQILGRYGWAHHHNVGDVDHWTRPGKDPKDGSSATTNYYGTGRFVVFTTATPFEPHTGSGPAPSYDRLDVVAHYDHAGDRPAAARALTGRPEPGARAAAGANTGTGSGPTPVVDVPRLGTAGLYGPAGEFLTLIAPHPEADPAAILVQFLNAGVARQGAYQDDRT